MQSASQTITVPVDVDTAFARVKRAFQFVSADDLGVIRSGSRDGSWKAAAIAEGAYAWDAQPGAYYWMGRDYGAPQYHESILVELEKNGAGTRMTVMFQSRSACI